MGTFCTKRMFFDDEPKFDPELWAQEGDFLKTTAKGACYRVIDVHPPRGDSGCDLIVKCERLGIDAVEFGQPGVFAICSYTGPRK